MIIYSENPPGVGFHQSYRQRLTSMLVQPDVHVSRKASHLLLWQIAMKMKMAQGIIIMITMENQNNLMSCVVIKIQAQGSS